MEDKSRSDTAWRFDSERAFVLAGLHGDDRGPGRFARYIAAWRRRRMA